MKVLLNSEPEKENILRSSDDSNSDSDNNSLDENGNPKNMIQESKCLQYDDNFEDFDLANTDEFPGYKTPIITNFSKKNTSYENLQI